MADCASFETLVSPSTWRIKYWRLSNMRFWLSLMRDTTFDSDLKSPAVILTLADLAIGAISCVAAMPTWLRTGDDGGSWRDAASASDPWSAGQRR